MEQIFLISMAMFQLVGALAVWSARFPRYLTVPTSLLLSLNSLLALFDALGRAGIPADDFAAVYLSLDSFTWVLIIAMVWPTTDARRPWLAPWPLALFANLPFVVVLITSGGDPSRWLDALLRALPYYVSTAGLLVAFSGREPVHRMIALAFLPRAIYLGIVPLESMVQGVFPMAPTDRLDYAFRGVLLAASLVAVYRLVTPPGRPRAQVTLLVAATGPLVWFSTRLASAGAWHLLFNHLSLAFLRPLVLYIALASPVLGPLVARSTALSAATVAPAMLLARAGMTEPAAMLLGLVVAMMLLAGWEAVRPFSAMSRSMASDQRDGRLQPADPEPQWLRVVRYLAGDGQGPPTRRTQAAIAAATGLRVQRVSDALRGLCDATTVAGKAATMKAAPSGESAPLVKETLRILPGQSRPVKVYELDDGAMAWLEAFEADSGTVIRRKGTKG